MLQTSKFDHKKSPDGQTTGFTYRGFENYIATTSNFSLEFLCNDTSLRTSPLSALLPYDALGLCEMRKFFGKGDKWVVCKYG